MLRFSFSLAAGLLLTTLHAERAWSVIVLAADDASQQAYADGWQVNDNGGGFGAWTTINNATGNGSGGGFLANNNAQSQINTSGKAFGLFGHSGGAGQAIRSLAEPLGVGHTFSLNMDNGFINSSGSPQPTVGFALQNSSGQNLFEFFFVGGQSEYRINRAGGSVGTGVGFTNQGLHLEFTLTGPTAFSFFIQRLADSPTVNTTVTGDLASPSGGQAISQLRLFNANAGQPNEHNVFFNSFSITAVPEASAIGFFGVALVLAAAGGRARPKRGIRAGKALELSPNQPNFDKNRSK